MSDYKIRTKPKGFKETFAGLARLLGISKAGASEKTRGSTTSPNRQPMKNIRRTN